MTAPAIVQSLLLGETPEAWIDYAVKHIELLLIDQANCEKKAASSAISLLYKAGNVSIDQRKLSKLAREELLHFEQVLRYMRINEIEYRKIGPGRYASSLHRWVRTANVAERNLDQLLVACMIEARSCERIGALLPHLNGTLRDLYLRLHESEGRHFEMYVEFAEEHFDRAVIQSRLLSLRALDWSLIDTEDDTFRFHSGRPMEALSPMSRT